MESSPPELQDQPIDRDGRQPRMTAALKIGERRNEEESSRIKADVHMERPAGVLDRKLPQLNGLEVLRRVHAGARTRSPPVANLNFTEFSEAVRQLNL